MVINHPLKKSRIFLVFFFWKHLWICMMNKNHFEGRVFNKLSRNRYLSVLVEYYELPSLQGTISYTYPASSGCRKIIFPKGGDILVPGRVVLNQATRSWNEDNSRSFFFEEKNPPLNYTTWKVDGDHQETSASVKVHEATRLVDTCTTTTNTRCQQLPGDRMTKDFKPSMIWEISENETRDW